MINGFRLHDTTTAPAASTGILPLHPRGAAFAGVAAGGQVEEAEDD
jgi:hypothetical protein